jgi:hypothetical protein
MSNPGHDDLVLQTLLLESLERAPPWRLVITSDGIRRDD